MKHVFHPEPFAVVGCVSDSIFTVKHKRMDRVTVQGNEVWNSIKCSRRHRNRNLLCKLMSCSWQLVMKWIFPLAMMMLNENEKPNGGRSLGCSIMYHRVLLSLQVCLCPAAVLIIKITYLADCWMTACLHSEWLSFTKSSMEGHMGNKFLHWEISSHCMETPAVNS